MFCCYAFFSKLLISTFHMIGIEQRVQTFCTGARLKFFKPSGQDRNVASIQNTKSQTVSTKTFGSVSATECLCQCQQLLQQCEVMLSYFTTVSRGLGVNVFHSWKQLFTTLYCESVKLSSDELVSIL